MRVADVGCREFQEAERGAIAAGGDQRRHGVGRMLIVTKLDRLGRNTEGQGPPRRCSSDLSCLKSEMNTRPKGLLKRFRTKKTDTDTEFERLEDQRLIYFQRLDAQTPQTPPRTPHPQSSFRPSRKLIPAYGKNQKAAKDFLRWFHSTEVYDTWFASQQGFSVGVTKAWENHKLWNDDPVMAPFRTAAESGRFAGYAGPAGRPAAETISKFIIVDMYAKAVQGMPAEEAVKWAHSELVKIYA